MNKGLYKEREYYYFYKFWKNPAENFGTTFVLESSPKQFNTWDWENWVTSDDPKLGGYRNSGWGWLQPEPFKEPAIGHRCLLQW